MRETSSGELERQRFPVAAGPLPPHTRLAFGQVAFLVALATACSAPAPPSIPISAANDRLVGASELIVVPSGSWGAGSHTMASTWPGAAVLQIRDERPVPSPLTLRLRLRGRPPKPLWMRWDGTRVDWLRARPGGAIEIEVPADRLAGSHRLEVRWNPLRSERPSFRAIRWSSGETQGQVLPADLPHLRRIDEFLTLGLVAAGESWSGGLLAVGAKASRLRSDSASPGLFRFEAVNLEGPTSDLVVSRSGWLGRRDLWRFRLAAGDRADGSIELAPGDVIELRRESDDPRALTLWGQPRLSERSGRRPLILVLTLDTTRRDALGVYGAGPGATPHLDRLAATATIFDRAYSTTSWTLPSHASMFTGLPPREHGAGVIDVTMRAEIPTLASLLAPRYRTAALVGGPLLRPIYGTGRGFGFYLAPSGVELGGGELTRRALELLESHAEESLFLFVNFFDPHFPYRSEHPSPAGVRAREAAAAVEPGGKAGRVLAGETDAFLDLIEQRVRLSAAEASAVELAYQSEVAEMDRCVGELLDAVRQAGRFDDALVVVAADHGELLGERGWWSHGVRLDPELTDIPLIVKLPGQRAPRRVAEPVSLIDVFPTVLAVAGVPGPERRAVVLTDERALSRRRSVAFEEHQSEVHPLYSAMQLGAHLVGGQDRVGRAIRWQDGEECWRTAPDDSRRISCEDGSLAELRAEVGRVELVPKASDRSSPPPLDDEERRRLRALGYL